jgi:hypothetical protein
VSNMFAVAAPQAPPAMVKALRLKLRKLSELPPSILLADLIDLCYAARRADVDEIKRRLKDTEDDFSRLAHYIGRLGATRSSADTIVRAVIEVPALRKISDVRTVNAPEPREVTIDQEYMSPYGAWWME